MFLTAKVHAVSVIIIGALAVMAGEDWLMSDFDVKFEDEHTVAFDFKVVELGCEIPVAIKKLIDGIVAQYAGFEHLFDRPRRWGKQLSERSARCRRKKRRAEGGRGCSTHCSNMPASSSFKE